MAERQHTEHTTLAGRSRDKGGEIHKKPGNTLVRTLREVYGDGFAKGYRPDATLGHVLKKEGVASLHELTKAMGARRRVVAVSGGDKVVAIASPGYFEDVSNLLGGRQVIGSSIESELDAHEMLSRGLPRAALSKLVENLHVIDASEASEALGISVRTLQRHKHGPPVVLLDVQQSGRAWRFAEILAKATRVLGSQDEAEQWLKRPAIGLDRQRPVDLLTTPAGVKLVEDYLGRLEYDVYT
jgi:putative toxin-antitoxin system antitoxin component (TIGR02293 family)